MKLNVGVTKKLGQPGFGSIGASCQLESDEFRGDSSGEEFARRIQRAFNMCRTAVEEEIRRQLGDVRQQDAPYDRGHESSEAIEYKQSGHFEDGKSRSATPKQLNALRAMATRSRLSTGEIERVFGGKPLTSLTVAEASAAIDQLKNGATSGASQSRRNGHAKGGP